jgi:eukaryotic-like serine/threonine-protein kinase
MHKEPGLTCIKLTGVVDEKFDSAPILREAEALTILDVSGVRRITSFGVRQWTEAMKALPTSVKHLYLVRCPAVFVDQLSMVLNFAGRAEVVSAFALCLCDSCGKETPLLLDFVGDRSSIATGQLPDATCESCQKPAQLADDPHIYVRLVNEFGAKAIEHHAAVVMERMGLHALRKVGNPPEATKLVHEQITMFRLSGTLDARFKQRRLASGVEGDVIFDLADIEGLDATGAERWRDLLGELGSATSITLVDVPEVLLPAIAGGVFAVSGAGLFSYQATFQCADCGNVESRAIRADEPLGACSRPCGRCGRDTGPSTSMSLIEEVFSKARPASVSPAVQMLIRDRHEILQRARAESGTVAAAQAATADSLARYRVIKPLSEGGMAEIFLAVHQGIAGFEKLVVLKKILRKMLERRQVAVQLFLNEAKIAANLNHPNIVQTFEVGEHGGDLYIAMEYIHGVDARRLLRQSILSENAVPIEQVLYICERVAAALHHAHTAKDLSGRQLSVVHRDVSPSNIILGFDGQVKLLDFGVASAAVGESFDGLIGKFSYMSPEQLARQPLDGRSDVFGLGVVMHEMLSRRPLFRRETDHETIRAVLHSEVPKLAPAVPDFVDAVIAKALARKRDERFADARAFQVAVDECIRKLGNMPTSEQIAHTLEKLFPDQSAAPAFDPSLYRSSGSESPVPYRSTPASGDREHPSQPKDHERTLVNPDAGNVGEDVAHETAIVAHEPAAMVEAQRNEMAVDAARPDARGRFATFPNVQVPPNPNQVAAAPRTPLPSPSQLSKVPLAPVTHPPQSRPPLTPAPSRPATLPPGLVELQPLTSPPSAKPVTLPPLSLPPSTSPLPAELVGVSLDKKRSSNWLIVAAVVVFILGFLLVVF